MDRLEYYQTQHHVRVQKTRIEINIYLLYLNGHTFFINDNIIYPQLVFGLFLCSVP
jgi:hypothetical protein